MGRSKESRVCFDFCFTALQHILGHFGRGQLTYPHCSWASLLGSLPVLSAHSFASNLQLLFLNQRKRENGRRNVFMTKSPRKNVPDAGIELGAACMPSTLPIELPRPVESRITLKEFHGILKDSNVSTYRFLIKPI